MVWELAALFDHGWLEWLFGGTATAVAHGGEATVAADTAGHHAAFAAGTSKLLPHALGSGGSRNVAFLATSTRPPDLIDGGDAVAGAAVGSDDAAGVVGAATGASHGDRGVLLTAEQLSPDPKIWGPQFWGMLHCIAANLPAKLTPELQHSLRDLFGALPSVLPCNICGKHFGYMLDADPIDGHLESGKDVFMWLVHLHNKVNAHLGKPLLSDVDAEAACIPSQCMAPGLHQLPPSPETAMAPAAAELGVAQVAQASAVWAMVSAVFAELARRPRGRRRLTMEDLAAFLPTVAH